MTTISRRHALALLSSAGCLAAMPRISHAQTTKTTAARCVPLYDNTFYTDIHVGQLLGFPRSNIIYYKPNTDWKARTDNGQLPPESDYKAWVAQNDNNPGPVVINFENIFLEGTDAAKVLRRAEMWDSLLTWTKFVVGSKRIGIFAFTDRLDSQYLSLARQLNPKIDAYFPELYRYQGVDDNEFAFEIGYRVNEVHEVDTSKPIYPYVWPQYVKLNNPPPNSETPGTFIDESRWRRQLDDISANTAVTGIIFWSQQTPVGDTNKGWVTATEGFLTDTC